MKYFTIDKYMKESHEEMISYQFGDVIIHVDGIIYVYGKKAGQESIEWMHKKILNEGYIPFDELHGAFSCIIHYPEHAVVFCDNSNMHCIYYSDEILSSSFLKVVEYETGSGKQLCFNLEALCEYITLGNVYFGKTFFEGVRILDSTEIAEIKDGKILISKKPIGDIDDPSNVKSFSDYFDKLAFSLSDMRVSQALTGGYDSRLVYACLSNRIKDHPALSANDINSADVICARKVAIANQDELEVVTIDKPEFSEDLINTLFIKKDGIIPFDIDGDIRLLTFKTKLAEKYNVHLTGDGGVLHKDWEWTQDFPFYKKRRSNAKRFYRQRLYYLSLKGHIGKALQDAFDDQERRFTIALESIAKSTNTQSYDSWYYRVSGNRRTDYSNNPVTGLVSYAPLDELDIVRYSYALPRWKRFFFNSMRETITKENKSIARIRTNYGTNASNESPYLFIDVFYQTVEFMRKACRLIGRKLIRKNVMSKSVLAWSLEKEMRDSNLAAKAINYSKQKKYLDSKVPMEKLSYAEIQRLIHIYYLFCFTSGYLPRVNSASVSISKEKK